MVKSDIYSTVWRSWAPAKCKIFLWMALQRKILTVDVLLLRGRDNNYFCPLCERNLETPTHLLLDCPWSRYAWEKIAQLAHALALLPASWDGLVSIKAWLVACHGKAREDRKKGTLSIIQLMAWEIWRERNRRIFQQEYLGRERFIEKAREEIRLWNMAGAGIPFDPGLFLSSC